MRRHRYGFLITAVLVGCSTPTNFDESLPIKPILPVPDIRQYYTPLHKDQYYALILYRDALLAYGKYLTNYIETMTTDGRLPILPPEITECMKEYAHTPRFELRSVPDVRDLSEADMRDKLVDYIEKIHLDHRNYNVALTNQSKKIEKACQ